FRRGLGGRRRGFSRSLSGRSRLFRRLGLAPDAQQRGEQLALGAEVEPVDGSEPHRPQRLEHLLERVQLGAVVGLGQRLLEAAELVDDAVALRAGASALVVATSTPAAPATLPIFSIASTPPTRRGAPLV